MFFSYFSRDGKVCKKIFADGSAAAQARSPQPSAWPPHAATGYDAYLHILKGRGVSEK